MDIEDRDNFIISKSEKFKRLKSNDDFIEYLGMLKDKQKQFRNILEHPKLIGSYESKNAGTNDNPKIEYFKYTKEDDTERIKEAQIRFNTFERCINAVDDFLRYADQIKENNKKKEERKKK